MSGIICTVDVVLLTLQEGELRVALLRRDKDPYPGVFALPGGYIHADRDQDTEDAAARMLFEKTGIISPYLEQLGTFSGAGRDPRGWSISVAYYALVAQQVLDSAIHDGLWLAPIDQAKSLPFDHQAIIKAALNRVRNKSSYSSLPVYLCGDTFTLPQLQAVYEAVLGEPVNKVSFRRKMEELAMLEPIEGALEKGKANRPAQLYRLSPRYAGGLSLTSRSLNPG